MKRTTMNVWPPWTSWLAATLQDDGCRGIIYGSRIFQAEATMKMSKIQMYPWTAASAAVLAVAAN